MSISGHKWRKVAFYEAHEMSINKDLKSVVVRPSQAYLQKISFFNSIEAYQNLTHELFPENFIGTANYNSINNTTPQAKHCKANK